MTERLPPSWLRGRPLAWFISSGPSPLLPSWGLAYSWSPSPIPPWPGQRKVTPSWSKRSGWPAACGRGRPITPIHVLVNLYSTPSLGYEWHCPAVGPGHPCSTAPPFQPGSERAWAALAPLHSPSKYQAFPPGQLLCTPYFQSRNGRTPGKGAGWVHPS